jgi:hypothetical protein
LASEESAGELERHKDALASFVCAGVDGSIACKSRCEATDTLNQGRSSLHRAKSRVIGSLLRAPVFLIPVLLVFERVGDMG